jgi:hypothetical protein
MKKILIVDRCGKCPNFKFNDLGSVKRWECHALIEEGTIRLLYREELDAQMQEIMRGYDPIFPEWCPLNNLEE